MAVANKILLITGIPGIGKTSVIKKVIQSFPGQRFAGFFSQEIRVDGIRQGFELVTLQGERYIMAHVDIDSPFRVGKYGVDVRAIEKATEEAFAIAGANDIFIVDEIGKMECFSGYFVRRISLLLESEKPVIATIAGKGSGFVAAVKRRPEIELWEVTMKNREAMPDKIAAWITGEILS